MDQDENSRMSFKHKTIISFYDWDTFPTFPIQYLTPSFPLWSALINGRQMRRDATFTCPILSYSMHGRYGDVHIQIQ